MRGFEWASTETRKIVKDEERIVHFLDNRPRTHDKGLLFKHTKLPECETCDLESICAGVDWVESVYHYVLVIPQKLSPEERETIIAKIQSL